ncbi:MAG: amino acid permease, partial [Anaerolineales bacterium]|nr:amino acid permease [Anaerolineales bacterium]
MTSQSNVAAPPAGRFGTFAGVFTPNVLTILGIILFLRLGWVVGQAGMWQALLIVFLANMISLLTGLSLSAVATSMNVKAGGNYYLISRSLGLEIGGAIGIPLYLSQAISVAFYIIGFTEALQAVPFFTQIDPRLVSTAVVLLFIVIAYVGADFALKIQFVILAILVSAIASFFLGGWGEFAGPHLAPAYTEGVTFWVAFAVFFPAVTGIEVGTSMSGDLKDPSRSIPRGTIASILVTAVIYMLVVVWFAVHTADPMELIEDTLAMQRIALWPVLILAGVWAATLSSALGSILAAPRTLQAIALDRVLPHWMAGQMGSATEPRVAILLTGAIALAVIWLGDLNAVAPIISMFFLNTYGMVNLTAGIEKFVSNPSYRPRFRVPWYISLLGALGCYSVMFLINPLATVVAIVISYGVYFFLERRTMERTWGDVRSGLWFTIARYALLQLEQQRWSPKNWRPNIMVFTGQPHNRQQLVEVANWLSLGKGIVTFFQFIVGDVEFLAGHGMRQMAYKHIRSYIQENNMMAFAEVEIVPDFMEEIGRA